jgi:hypothetical protein
LAIGNQVGCHCAENNFIITPCLKIDWKNNHSQKLTTKDPMLNFLRIIHAIFVNQVCCFWEELFIHFPKGSYIKKNWYAVAANLISNCQKITLWILKKFSMGSFVVSFCEWLFFQSIFKQGVMMKLFSANTLENSGQECSVHIKSF